MGRIFATRVTALAVSIAALIGPANPTFGASADGASFLGSWAAERSCVPAETKTYGRSALESDFAVCRYTDVASTAPEQWNVQAECTYEGRATPVTFELAVSGDWMQETTVTEDGHRQELGLFRCQSSD